MATIDQGATSKTAGAFSDPVEDATTGYTSASATGTIQLMGDRDWYTLSATADTRYTVTLKPATDSGPLSVKLRDKSGKELTQGVITGIDGDGYATWSFVNGVKPAVFYVDVAGTSTSVLGDYEVTYLAEPDVGETTKTTGVFEFAAFDRTTPQDATQIDNTLQWAGDKDWFKLDAQADARYSITLTGDGTSPLGVGKLSLFDKSGRAVTVDVTTSVVSGSPDSLVLTFTNLGKAASYFVQVSGVNDADLGDYALNAQAIADDHGDSAKPAIAMTTLLTTAPVSGEIQWAKDRDWVKLDALADRQYTVTLTTGTAAGELATGGLRLLDKSGKEVTSNATVEQEADGSWTLVFLNALKAASYFIEVAGADDLDLGTYTLTVVDPLYDEGQTSKTTSVFTTDGVQTLGSIQRSNDKDWFKLSAEANRYYTITLGEGAADPLTDGRLRLLNKSGQEVVNALHGVDATGNRTLTFINPDKKADYFVEVTAATSETVSGAYTLDLTLALDHATTNKTVGVLASVAVVDPALPPDEIQWTEDKDWFKLTAAVDTQYTITLGTGVAAGELANGTLRLLDKSGKPVTADVTVVDDTDGPTLTFVNANKAAVYFVEVAGKTSADLGTYSLGLTEKIDSQGQTAKTSTTVVAGTPVTGAIDWAKDKDWFKLDVEAFALYRLTLTADVPDSTVDYQLLVRDSKGQVLERTTYLKTTAASDTLMLAYLNVTSKKTSVYIEIAGLDSDTTDLAFELSVQKMADEFNDFGTGFDPQVALMGLPDVFWSATDPALS